MHHARSKISRSSVWAIITSMGDWHLVMYVLDPVFGRSRGFRLLKLAQIPGAYDLNPKSSRSHMRYVVPMPVMKGLQHASLERLTCAGRVASHMCDILNALRKQPDGGAQDFSAKGGAEVGNTIAFLANHEPTEEFSLRERGKRQLSI